MTELVFLAGMIAAYYAGCKRGHAVARDLELMQMKSRALTAEVRAAHLEIAACAVNEVNTYLHHRMFNAAASVN